MASFIGFVKRNYAAVNPPVSLKTEDAIRFGVLGAATIAPEAFVLPAMSHAEAVSYAVAARDLNRAQSFAKKYGIEKAYGGSNAYQDLLNDPLVQAIYIALPTSLHYEWTMKALTAGKHVLIEKPSAGRAAETSEMFALAEKKGLVLLEDFHHRFHPALLRTKAILESGEVGAVKSVHISMRIPNIFLKTTDIRFVHALGGGAMMDMGCYAVDCLRYFTDSNPISVLSATPDVFTRDNGTPDYELVDAGMTGSLAFPSDILGTFDVHLFVPPRFGIIPTMPEMDARIVCDAGELELVNLGKPTIFHSIKVKFKAPKGGSKRRIRVEKAYTPSDGSKGEEWWTSYRYLLEGFVDKIKGREPHVWPDAQNSIDTLDWMEKVYEKSGLGARPASTFRLPA